MKLKQFLIIILVLVIASFIGYKFGKTQIGSFKSVIEPIQEHHSPPSVVIEPGSAVETASYIIFHDDEGFIYAKNGDTGKIEFSGTDAATVINWALSSLKPDRIWREKVVVKGNFIIDSPIKIPSWTIFQIIGEITLAPNSNCNMIENEDWTNGNEEIEIYGGRLYGNRQQQSSGDGIHFEFHGTNPYDSIDGEEIFIHHLEVMLAKDDGVHIDMSGSGSRHVWMDTCRVTHAGDRGIFFQGFDSKFEHITVSGIGSQPEEGNIVLYYPSNCHFDNIYCSGGGLHNIYAKRGHHLQFSNIRLDNPRKEAALLEGIYDYTFTNIQIRSTINLDADNTYSAITLRSDLSHHSLDNNFVGVVYDKDGTNDYKYVIEEVDSNQDYNIFVGVNGRDAETGTLRVLGANSEYGTIVGSVITS